MKTSTDKTKVMDIGNGTVDIISMDGIPLEEVNSFKYLEAILSKVGSHDRYPDLRM